MVWSINGHRIKVKNLDPYAIVLAIALELICKTFKLLINKHKCFMIFKYFFFQIEYGRSYILAPSEEEVDIEKNILELLIYFSGLYS